MDIKVLKFGGSSQSLETYNIILNRLKNDKNTKYIIVLSAIKGITNNLIDFVNLKNFSVWKQVLNKNKELALECNCNNNKFIKEMENKLWDLENDKIEIMAMGEFFTTNILSHFLQKNLISAKFISSFDVIKSNQHNIGIYNKGEFTVDYEIILNELEKSQVVIIPGFSGYSLDNLPCLLGRGGSDTSGSIIAEAVNASVYEIWTDVDGIYTCDPRYITGTKIIKNIGYNASQEIAAMGAKVIHPYCILPCAKKNIPIIIKNSFNSDALINTKIGENSNDDIYAITMQNNVKVFKITSQNMWNNFGFVYEIFSIFKKYNVDINIINTSQFNITTTTDDTHVENLFEIVLELSQKYAVKLVMNNTIVSIIGDKIRNYKNIGKIFEITQKYDIILTSYSSNDMTLSWVLDSEKANDFSQELHSFLFSL